MRRRGRSTTPGRGHARAAIAAAVLGLVLAQGAYGQSLLAGAGFSGAEAIGDVVEQTATGGIVIQRQDLEIRAESAVLLYDLETWTAMRASMETANRGGLPRRGFEQADPRRTLSDAVLRDRLRRFLSAVERKPTAEGDSTPEFDFELVRSMYLEGGVQFFQSSREVLHAERVMYSVLDDRAVFEDVTMRLYRIDDLGQERVVVVRTERLVREGARFVGRDVSVTTCDAGDPHFEMFSGETEIIERADEFEIRSKDNWLAFSGRRVVPLPNVTQFTGSPINSYIEGATAGYSDENGAELQVDFGAPMNEFGGAVHEWLTGRSPERFRGRWHVGVGYLQERGVPLDGTLTYESEGLYRGRTDGFTLRDSGDDIHVLQNYIDGTPIDATDRQLLRSENRIEFSDTTSLDLTAFWARDPAVYSEFYNQDWVQRELPETTAHFRHQKGNKSLQALGRWNLADFSYTDSRQLTSRFVEREPDISFDMLSERLFELPGGAPVLLTSASGYSRVRSNFDDRFASPIDDETQRLDQELELAVPFRIGETIGARTFVSGRFTHFDETVAGTSRERMAFTAGASFGTRLSKDWSWTEEDGSKHALRHVVSPTVRFEHRFKVDGDPGDYHQFDALDALDEGANVRVGVLQRLQKREQLDEDSPAEIREVVWLDLAQNFTPISERDNNGHHAGLAEFEAILRPRSPWAPVDDLTFVFEGEHDWDRSELRTFNSYMRFQALGPTWYVGYRADQTSRGVLQFGSTLGLRGRWVVGWTSQYDFQSEQMLTYRAMLIRQDHDWQLVMAVLHNDVIGETSFTVDFVPQFGGLFRTRGSRSYVGDVFGGLRFSEY